MKRIFFIIALLHGACFGQARMDPSSQLAFRATNDGTTGTTLNQLAKMNSSGNALNAATTDTGVPVYVVVGSAGTTGVAQLAAGGAVSCKFDAGGGTSGHYVQTSGSVAGTCHDSGASIPSTGWVLGTLLTSPAANATGSVLLVQGYLASSGGFAGGTLTSELIFAAPGTGAASANWQTGTAPTTPVAGDCWRDATGINCVEDPTANGTLAVKSSGTGAVCSASFICWTGDSNVPKIGIGTAALEFNAESVSSLTASQLVAGNGNGELQALGSLGTTTTVLHGNAGGLPSYASVARADLGADAVGWQFLGTTSLGSATATIAVTPSTVRKHYMVRLIIAGYGGTGVARAQLGNTSTIDTGSNYGFNGMNMAPSTAAALTAVGSNATGQNGVPVSGSLTTAGRFVQLNISNPGAAIKYFTIETSGAGSGATAPNLAYIAGVWNNTTAGIGGFQFTACTATTSTCTTTTFLTGTTLTVWGRDDN